MTEVDGSRHVQRSIERKIREALEVFCIDTFTGWVDVI
jgi:hypothetical protein